MLTVLLAASLAAATAAPSAPAWHDGLDWRGEHVAIRQDAQGGYILSGPSGQRAIGRQAFAADTASPLFDGLYAMAQDDLRGDSVTAIRDEAVPPAARGFNYDVVEGKPKGNQIVALAQTLPMMAQRRISKGSRFPPSRWRVRTTRA